MKKVFLVVPALLFLFSETIFSQIVVTPPYVLLRSSKKISSYIVENRSDKTQEITIRFQFGYPFSDSVGNMGMEYHDTTAEKKYSIAENISAFPKRFILQPGQQQTVRLSIHNAQKFTDGIYWARLITRALPQQVFVDSVGAGVTTAINFAFEQITTVAYAAGNLSVSLEAEGKGIMIDSQQVRVLWNAIKTGNSPFLGTVKYKLFDSRNNQIYDSFETVGIYQTMMKRTDFPIELFQSHSSYTVEFTIESERSDIPAEDIVQTKPLIARFNFTLP